jgi:hypothetical protein
VDGHLPKIRWDAAITLPPDHTGALGDVVGGGTLRWSGDADRVSLAAHRDGVVTALDGPSWSLDLLTAGPPRPGLRRHLPAQLDLATAHDREVVPLLSLPAAPPSTTTVLSPGSGVGTRPPRPRPPQAEAFEAAMVATTLTMMAPPPPQRGSYERFE